MNGRLAFELEGSIFPIFGLGKKKADEEATVASIRTRAR
jgi:hypothetical protein